MTSGPDRRLILACLALLVGGCVNAPRQEFSPLRPGSANLALETAFDQLGMPYRYGGEHPDEGFDCSGLVQFSFGRAGVAAPRTVAEQYQWAQPVGRHELLPGDLVFFRTAGRSVSHVGIYVGDGRFIHAPKSGRRVTFSELANPYWQSRYAGAGRAAGS